jgi:hypothetical protein
MRSARKGSEREGTKKLCTVCGSRNRQNCKGCSDFIWWAVQVSELEYRYIGT